MCFCLFSLRFLKLLCYVFLCVQFLYNYKNLHLLLVIYFFAIADLTESFSSKLIQRTLDVCCQFSVSAAVDDASHQNRRGQH